MSEPREEKELVKTFDLYLTFNLCNLSNSSSILIQRVAPVWQSHNYHLKKYAQFACRLGTKYVFLLICPPVVSSSE
jgi:hypothetical protein